MAAAALVRSQGRGGGTRGGRGRGLPGGAVAGLSPPGVPTVQCGARCQVFGLKIGNYKQQCSISAPGSYQVPESWVHCPHR